MVPVDVLKPVCVHRRDINESISGAKILIYHHFRQLVGEKAAGPSTAGRYRIQ